MTLQYGNAPDIDEAIDLGRVPDAVAGPKIQNLPDMAQTEQNRAFMGSTVPPVRRCWQAVAYFRGQDIEYPYRAEIGGLGTIVVGLDPYNCEEWVLYPYEKERA